jgi:protein-tyrosine kinase
MTVVERTILKLREQQQAAQTSAVPEALKMSEPDAAPLATDTIVPRLPGIILERGVLRAAGLLPPEEDIDLLARQYRKIKRPIVAQATGRGVPRMPNGYLVMIASAMAGEGKSFTAMNIALSLAREKDLEVLLVDADVAKPQLSRVLGLADAPGLLDALRNVGSDIESLIRATDVPALSFLPAGTGAQDATELLSSSRMESLTERLGQRSRRIVVFDSPPLLQTTESAALVHIAGQIVVVVRAESTPQPVLLDALQILEGHPSVSLVLNQSIRSASDDYYYYGYGSGSRESNRPSG